MGWNGADQLMSAIAPSLADVDKESRKKVYRALVDWANAEDWDTHDESMGIDPALDEVLVEGGYVQAQEDC